MPFKSGPFSNRLRMYSDETPAYTTSGPVVYGSRRPGVFLDDMANGKDSLDIILIGDSNTGSAIAGFWGYFSGLCESLNARGLPMYGTTLCAPFSPYTAGTSASVGIWRGDSYLPGTNNSVLRANDNGTNVVFPEYSTWESTDNFTRLGSSQVGTGNTRDKCAVLATNSDTYFSTYGVNINSDHPLAAAGNNLWYRIRYGTVSGSGGQFVLCAVRGDNSSFLMPGGRILRSTQAGAPEFKMAEQDFPTTGTFGYRTAFAYTTNAGEQTRGPLIVYCHSLYKKSKGWSVHSHGYLGGYSTDGVAATIVASKNQIKLLLQETRERQVAAGGSGRVLVMCHGGVNATAGAGLPETPEKWTNSMRTVMNLYKDVWASLGYSSEDIAFVAFPSHQIDAADNSSNGSNGNMATVRAAANKMYLSDPDITVVDTKQLMNYNQFIMGTGEINATGVPALAAYGKPYYQRIGNWPNAGLDFPQHLSGGKIGANWHPTDGYTIVCNMILNNLLSSAN